MSQLKKIQDKKQDSEEDEIEVYEESIDDIDYEQIEKENLQQQQQKQKQQNQVKQPLNQEQNRSQNKELLQQKSQDEEKTNQGHYSNKNSKRDIEDEFFEDNEENDDEDQQIENSNEQDEQMESQVQREQQESQLQYDSSNDEDQKIFEEFQILIQQGFSQIKNEDFYDGLQKVEQAIYKMQQMDQEEAFGENFYDIIQAINKEAIKCLNQGNFKKSKALLMKCDSLTQPQKFGNYPELNVLTLNNYGCYFRRTGDVTTALQQFKKALSVLQTIQSQTYLGLTRLNISAIMSQTGKFDQAIKNSNEALKHFQYELDQLKEIIFQNKIDKEEQQKINNQITQCVKNISICFYNMAVSQEALQEMEDAYNNYRQAYLIIQQYMGTENSLYEKFRNIFEEFLIKNGEVKKVQKQQKGQQNINRGGGYSLGNQHFSNRIHNQSLRKGEFNDLGQKQNSVRANQIKNNVSGGKNILNQFYQSQQQQKGFQAQSQSQSQSQSQNQSFNQNFQKTPKIQQQQVNSGIKQVNNQNQNFVPQTNSFQQNQQVYGNQLKTNSLSLNTRVNNNQNNNQSIKLYEFETQQQQKMLLPNQQQIRQGRPQSAGQGNRQGLNIPNKRNPKQNNFLNSSGLQNLNNSDQKQQSNKHRDLSHQIVVENNDINVIEDNQLFQNPKYNNDNSHNSSLPDKNPNNNHDEFSDIIPSRLIPLFEKTIFQEKFVVKMDLEQQIIVILIKSNNKQQFNLFVTIDDLVFEFYESQITEKFVLDQIRMLIQDLIFNQFKGLHSKKLYDQNDQFILVDIEKSKENTFNLYVVQ